ncbi:hypothetical protein [Chitinophaga sp. XS-30]|uniref:hypothetical protein n=1 Tax=Chitinophaga sp. XS-30 TaxID=2604421 RepID=UPI0011DDD3DA|nr:hypothetical protein [Chitinophaga sp. XS-30]QEH41506.1 hypothetical protein FW415_11680 [Chitinophaga sp. XS-30]
MKKVLPLLWLLLPLSSPAQKQQFGERITIDKPVYENLYIAAGTVIINAPVHGDLVVAGGTVIINDSVTNDILAGGGEVTINGHIGDDVRCVGGKLFINGVVAGDLAVSGGRVHIARTAIIGGSMIAGGGEVKLDGTVKDFVKAGAGDMQINGSIEKHLDCRSGTIAINGTVGGDAILAARDIQIGPNAAFLQSVRYWADDRQTDFRQSVRNGQAVFDESLQMETPRWEYLGYASALGLLWYLGAVFLFILIIQYLFGGMMQKAGASLAGNSLRLAGYGFLFLVLAPIGIAIICISLIGLPLGMLLLTAYISLVLLSTVIAAVIIANWVNIRYKKAWKFWNLVWTSLGIFILLKLVSLVPFIGWIAMLIIVCLVFGALMQHMQWRKQAQRI